MIKGDVNLILLSKDPSFPSLKPIMHIPQGWNLADLSIFSKKDPKNM